MGLRASWQETAAPEETPDTALSRSIAAVAAALAETEGLVCHLTSLVLVDEAGAAQEGLLAQRKLATMTPALISPQAAAAPMLASPEFLASPPPLRSLFRRAGPRQAAVTPPPPRPPRTHRAGSGGQDWRGLRLALGLLDRSTAPEALRRGELASLPPALQAVVRRAAGWPEIAALAQSLGAAPEVVVLALIAEREAEADRGARRFARAVLGRADPAAVAATRAAIGLCGNQRED